MYCLTTLTLAVSVSSAQIAHKERAATKDVHSEIEWVSINNDQLDQSSYTVSKKIWRYLLKTAY